VSRIPPRALRVWLLMALAGLVVGTVLWRPFGLIPSFGRVLLVTLVWPTLVVAYLLYRGRLR
jgi:hypothetical protein